MLQEIDPFPFKPRLATLQNLRQMTKPILSKELEDEIEATIEQYRNKAKWHQWGLSHLRKQGSCILLFGPTGTGKSLIAAYLAHKAGMALRSLDIAGFGSKTPGENERGIEVFFKECGRDKACAYLNECDSILWSRDSATGESQWMVSIINKLLTCVEQHEYLCILATNRPAVLDPAIDRRVLAKIEVPRPAFAEQLKLWQAKIPKKFPFQPTMAQLQEMAGFGLTGAEIENAIIRASQIALRAKMKQPTFELLCNVAKVEHSKSTAHTKE